MAARMVDTKSGIYKIANSVNGCCYVGSAVNIKARWAVHISTLNNQKHHSRYLQNAWNKYGASYFTFSILEVCDKSMLMEREQFYIDTLRPKYNILPLAIGGSTKGKKAWNKGVPQTEEMRRINSESHMGQIPWNKGVTHTSEARQKISERAKGRTPWNKGKPSLMKGKSLSKEHKQKIGNAHRGKKVSLETRIKIGLKSIGRYFSDEARKKMSESQKKRWERERANG